MTEISDVVFDVGRVLIDFNYERFAARLRAHGASFEGEEGFLERVDLLGYELGEISSGEFLRQINCLLSDPLPLDQLAEAWNDLFSPIREMLAVAGTLKQNCCVYLLSNTSELHWQYLQERFGLDKICCDMLASYEVGAMKPSAEIFSIACSRFDLQPETTLFIDDRKENVEGAIACGWQGIWHRSVAETKRQLTRLTGLDC